MTATTCPVCERTAPARRHPCRFERACLCWHGRPCGPESRGPDSWARTARIFAAVTAQAEGDPRDLG